MAEMEQTMDSEKTIILVADCGTLIHSVPRDTQRFMICALDRYDKGRLHWIDSFATKQAAEADVERRAKYRFAWWRKSTIIECCLGEKQLAKAKANGGLRV